MYEFPTLFAVWSHCVQNPSDLAFYIHTKTIDTLRQKWQHDMFHDPGMVTKALQQGSVIWTPAECGNIGINCMTRGNFWWARCDHVNKLNNPFNPSFLKEVSVFKAFPPHGRYRAEWWILNDFLGERPKPMLRPKSDQLTKRLKKLGRDPDVCVHPEHGKLCRRVAVAGQWGIVGKPPIVPGE